MVGIGTRSKALAIRLGAIGLLVMALAAGARADVSAELRVLTGAHSRIVWVRDMGTGIDLFARSNQLRLIGLDTDDGRGEREILPGPGSFNRPLITPTGRQIVFSDYLKKIVCVVNWDGTGLRAVCKGVAAGLWMDAATRTEWVYVQAGPPEEKDFRNNPLYRVRLDDPKVVEEVWTKGPSNPDEFQVSPDGKTAISLFPWPHVAVIRMPNESLTEVGQGCCPSMSPDNGDLIFHLIGDHRHLIFYELSKGRKWQVQVNTAPGIEGFEIYHPRWSNRTRYVVMTGPYRGQGGASANVYVGQLDPALERFDQWVQITADPRGDFYPDLWVNPGAPAAAVPAVTPAVPPVAAPAVIPATPPAVAPAAGQPRTSRTPRLDLSGRPMVRAAALPAASVTQ